jgi:hypothetical protein
MLSGLSPSWLLSGIAVTLPTLRPTLSSTPELRRCALPESLNPIKHFADGEYLAPWVSDRKVAMCQVW